MWVPPSVTNCSTALARPAPTPQPTPVRRTPFSEPLNKHKKEKLNIF